MALSNQDIRAGRKAAAELVQILQRSLTVAAPAGTFKAQMQAQQRLALARAERFVKAATVELAAYSVGGAAHLDVDYPQENQHNEAR